MADLNRLYQWAPLICLKVVFGQFRAHAGNWKDRRIRSRLFFQFPSFRLVAGWLHCSMEVFSFLQLFSNSSLFLVWLGSDVNQTPAATTLLFLWFLYILTIHLSIDYLLNTLHIIQFESFSCRCPDDTPDKTASLVPEVITYWPLMRGMHVDHDRTQSNKFGIVSQTGRGNQNMKKVYPNIKFKANHLNIFFFFFCLRTNRSSENGSVSEIQVSSGIK